MGDGDGARTAPQDVPRRPQDGPRSSQTEANVGGQDGTMLAQQSHVEAILC